MPGLCNVFAARARGRSPAIACALHQAWQAQLQFQVRLEEVEGDGSLLMVKRSGHLADRLRKRASDRKNSTAPIKASARKGCHTVSSPAPR